MRVSREQAAENRGKILHTAAQLFREKGFDGIGSEQLLVDEKGESRISNQDFAVAVINELEQAQHHQQRFTVGY